MKDILSNIDVFYIVKELQKYLSCRVNNIYEQHSKSFVLKLDYEKTKEKGIELIVAIPPPNLPHRPELSLFSPNTTAQKKEAWLKKNKPTICPPMTRTDPDDVKSVWKRGRKKAKKKDTKSG